MLPKALHFVHADGSLLAPIKDTIAALFETVSLKMDLQLTKSVLGSLHS